MRTQALEPTLPLKWTSCRVPSIGSALNLGITKSRIAILDQAIMILTLIQPKQANTPSVAKPKQKKDATPQGQANTYTRPRQKGRNTQ